MVLGVNVRVYGCVVYMLALLSPGNWSKVYKAAGRGSKLNPNREPFSLAAGGAAFPCDITAPLSSTLRQAQAGWQGLH